MRRALVALVGIVGALGVATFAAAQIGTPSATPGPAACASPAAAPAGATATMELPAAGTPAVCGAPVAGPALEAVDLAFKPTELTIPANAPVAVTVRNGGVALHNFSIDALNINQDLLPGETKTMTIQAPPGDYQFYCAIPGHKQAGMVGILHVR